MSEASETRTNEREELEMTKVNAEVIKHYSVEADEDWNGETCATLCRKCAQTRRDDGHRVEWLGTPEDQDLACDDCDAVGANWGG
jgi:hypothetical protein